MTTTLKIIIGALSTVILGVAGYFLIDNLVDSGQKQLDTPEKIIAEQKDLLTEAGRLQTSIGTNCEPKKDFNKKLEDIEKELADLIDRKKQWLDNVPKLPDINLGDAEVEKNTGRPGTEVPELSSTVPPLPDFDPVVLGAPGSQVPELSSDIPSLPDIDPEYIPEMPELNTGRPGTEIPELSTDAPPLPEIDFVDPDEYIFQMTENEQKLADMLATMKDLCRDDTKEPAKKVISDKCTDTCQRYKDCAAYTEDVTAADLDDAYNTCMEECPTWPKNMIKCINAIEIKNPNDCVSFAQCQVPQFYNEKYGQ